MTTPIPGDEQTPQELEAAASLTDATIEQHHREQVENMATCIEDAIVASLGGFPWRRSLSVIDEACQLARQRFHGEAARTPLDKAWMITPEQRALDRAARSRAIGARIDRLEAELRELVVLNAALIAEEEGDGI
jgi:hypothetical protein